jgi:hypothetical protein
MDQTPIFKTLNHHNTIFPKQAQTLNQNTQLAIIIKTILTYSIYAPNHHKIPTWLGGEKIYLHPFSHNTRVQPKTTFKTIPAKDAPTDSTTPRKNPLTTHTARAPTFNNSLQNIKHSFGKSSKQSRN